MKTNVTTNITDHYRHIQPSRNHYSFISHHCTNLQNIHICILNSSKTDCFDPV